MKKNPLTPPCYSTLPLLLLSLLPLCSPLSAHSQSAGIPFSYTLEGKDFLCRISYHITGRMPIKIKRQTNGQVDFLIIQTIKESQAQELHQLIASHPAWFQPFMPLFIQEYGTSPQHARKSIRANRGRKFGIFHQAHPHAPLRLIGIVGTHSPRIYDAEKNSIDGVYALGHPHYIQVKGAGFVAIKALFDQLIANRTAGILVLTIHQDNAPSLRIARKLGMHQDPQANKHHPWPYAENPDEVFVFHLSAAEWKKKYFPKN